MMINLTPSDIDIISDIRNKEMVVFGDPTQIHQVVTNLITNSVHALSDKGGKIEVIIEKADIIEKHRDVILFPRLKTGQYARITIKDNGHGIDKGIIHNIFDPFFTTKSMGQGTGMGLSVVHGIIQGHNGALSVESEPGQGAAFHCYFPIIEACDKNAKSDIDFENSGKGNERILLVDDELLVLDLYKNILKNLGYHVISCSESCNALKIFKDQPNDFDLVITDNIMAEMSGVEMSREILKIRPDIPIILITGNISLTEYELKKAGIRTFIQKPFERKKMQSVIREILDENE